MKFSRLYRESSLFWPSEITIDDGELRKGGGGYFPTLSKIARETEGVQVKINNWHDLMCWAIFCSFHKAAIDRLEHGDSSPVRYTELNQAYMSSKFSKSLNMTYPSWPRFMKAQYINDAKS